jgi:hypothetical protein
MRALLPRQIVRSVMAPEIAALRDKRSVAGNEPARKGLIRIRRRSAKCWIRRHVVIPEEEESASVKVVPARTSDDVNYSAAGCSNHSGRTIALRFIAVLRIALTPT